ncbi:hypothetical protein RsS62_50560 [Rhizobium dioscoreae]|uniref:Uncharacterized protein n=1 Tax=Rhizobium dioscoreae TaxID=2653122 RepID=A0ABQ0YYZ9_9HYPH|nr:MULTISPECIES: hypothetical protein [Rhizobium]MCZ3377394.1 hypothetical protein [Rhizobium sp. AG207R]GES45804.1 hypothetical protein RsS62_50560 [Rhizobium dioscoreae]GES48167.1 hypothetical protein RsS93_07810 [Rhizobium dioscoreae]GLU79365.1 hypothetical protein Rhsp01_05410 [Rhizobium sp. NBRC 114257]
MIEMLQGLLACIAAALFFVAMVIAMKSAIWNSPMPSLKDEDSGAPEGDQIHFRIVEDSTLEPRKPAQAAKLRRR